MWAEWAEELPSPGTVYLIRAAFADTIFCSFMFQLFFSSSRSVFAKGRNWELIIATCVPLKLVSANIVTVCSPSLQFKWIIGTLLTPFSCSYFRMRMVSNNTDSAWQNDYPVHSLSVLKLQLFKGKRSFLECIQVVPPWLKCSSTGMRHRKLQSLCLPVVILCASAFPGTVVTSVSFCAAVLVSLFMPKGSWGNSSVP